MKTIFDNRTREELIARIKTITFENKAQWGKMNVTQMLVHCIKWEEMALGKTKHKQSFLGKLFGKYALKDFIGDDSPFKKNVPTLSFLKINETNRSVTDLKEEWTSLIQKYNNFDNENFTHPFFGKMTSEQLGYLAYKHTDHHLRQFGQ